MQATFDTIETGDVLKLGDSKYIVLRKSDIILLVDWPSHRNTRSFEPEEFNALGYIKS
jgi:hypothetical protein